MSNVNLPPSGSPPAGGPSGPGGTPPSIPGIPSSVMKQGPSAVQAYAKAHNITLPTPPSGSPPGPPPSTSGTSTTSYQSGTGSPSAFS